MKPQQQTIGMFVAALFLSAALCHPATAAPPKRICSLWMAVDEILLALVPKERIVCVNEWVDKTPRLKGKFPKNIPRMTQNIEKVIAAQPDIVFATRLHSSKEFLNLLKKSRLKVRYIQDWGSFRQIAANIILIGDIVGESAKARRLAARFTNELNAIRKQASCEARKPRVISWAGDWAAGRHTTVHDLIEYAGGVNVGAQAGLNGWEMFSLEKLIAADPDVVLYPGETGDFLKQAPALKSSRAYRQKGVLTFPSQPVTAVSPAVSQAVRAVAKALHPKCFR